MKKEKVQPRGSTKTEVKEVLGAVRFVVLAEVPAVAWSGVG